MHYLTIAPAFGFGDTVHLLRLTMGETFLHRRRDLLRLRVAAEGVSEDESR